jgi:hypothetical protein
MENLRNIRIIGGIHVSKRHVSWITEEQLDRMQSEIADVIGRIVSEDAWITITYTKELGSKINS